ncbi:diguanylate cyclase [Roseofilum reptotaenium CS-1145]|nr:diguanylate cyclase [Roseofilum reptotaenium]MDB9516866.1 diguanylate cyclase [Roseofilum reptotaenium CS-1145]
MTKFLNSEAQLMKPEDCLLLVVDDNPDNLKVLRGVLSPIGYKLTFAMGGRQAIDRVKKAKPDLILLDLMMPDMDGFQVCEWLKADSNFKDIPLIFLTASQEMDHLLQAFEKGAIDYLTKPFHPPELLARVKTHLELKHLRERSQRQAEKELIVLKIIQGIHYSLNLEEILTTTVFSIQALFCASRVMICRCVFEEEYQIVAIADSPKAKTLSIGETVKIQSFVNPESKDRQFEIYAPVGLDRNQVKTHLSVPIYQQNDLWGILIVDCDDISKAWHSPEYQILVRIVEQIAIAIKQSQLYDALQQANQELGRLVNVDALTQVANRRYFDQHLEHEWRRLQREALPLSLILCDIDYFKQYNDTYGHIIGDCCLEQVAQALSSTLKRPADLIARYGGEEFAAILPNTPLKGAITVAEQMQQAIGNLNIPHMTTELPEPIVTISLGIACVTPTPYSHLIRLLDLADRALYEAKHKGRNRYAIGV